eukprot:GHVN01088132.1.p1 GENE.GHVN01088132.1~~GHVN01088132.1.p1  ORF type:complete len:1248 (-),score=178.06 GHVN01088132.1:3003-6746(-)
MQNDGESVSCFLPSEGRGPTEKECSAGITHVAMELQNTPFEASCAKGKDEVWNSINRDMLEEYRLSEDEEILSLIKEDTGIDLKRERIQRRIECKDEILPPSRAHNQETEIMADKPLDGNEQEESQALEEPLHENKRLSLLLMQQKTRDSLGINIDRIHRQALESLLSFGERRAGSCPGLSALEAEAYEARKTLQGLYRPGVSLEGVFAEAFDAVTKRCMTFLKEEAHSGEVCFSELRLLHIDILVYMHLLCQRLFSKKTVEETQPTISEWVETCFGQQKIVDFVLRHARCVEWNRQGEGVLFGYANAFLCHLREDKGMWQESGASFHCLRMLARTISALPEESRQGLLAEALRLLGDEKTVVLGGTQYSSYMLFVLMSIQHCYDRLVRDPTEAGVFASRLAGRLLECIEKNEMRAWRALGRVVNNLLCLVDGRNGRDAFLFPASEQFLRLLVEGLCRGLFSKDARNKSKKAALVGKIFAWLLSIDSADGASQEEKMPVCLALLRGVQSIDCIGTGGLLYLQGYLPSLFEEEETKRRLEEEVFPEKRAQDHGFLLLQRLFVCNGGLRYAKELYKAFLNLVKEKSFGIQNAIVELLSAVSKTEAFKKEDAAGFNAITWLFKSDYAIIKKKTTKLVASLAAERAGVLHKAGRLDVSINWITQYLNGGDIILDALSALSAFAEHTSDPETVARIFSSIIEGMRTHDKGAENIEYVKKTIGVIEGHLTRVLREGDLESLFDAIDPFWECFRPRTVLRVLLKSIGSGEDWKDSPIRAAVHILFEHIFAECQKSDSKHNCGFGILYFLACVKRDSLLRRAETLRDILEHEKSKKKDGNVFWLLRLVGELFHERCSVDKSVLEGFLSLILDEVRDGVLENASAALEAYFPVVERLNRRNNNCGLWKETMRILAKTNTGNDEEMQRCFMTISAFINRSCSMDDAAMLNTNILFGKKMQKCISKKTFGAMQGKHSILMQLQPILARRPDLISQYTDMFAVLLGEKKAQRECIGLIHSLLTKRSEHSTRQPYEEMLKATQPALLRCVHTKDAEAGINLLGIFDMCFRNALCPPNTFYTETLFMTTAEDTQLRRQAVSVWVAQKKRGISTLSLDTLVRLLAEKPEDRGDVSLEMLYTHLRPKEHGRLIEKIVSRRDCLHRCIAWLLGACEAIRQDAEIGGIIAAALSACDADLHSYEDIQNDDLFYMALLAVLGEAFTNAKPAGREKHFMAIKRHRATVYRGSPEERRALHNELLLLL